MDTSFKWLKNPMELEFVFQFDGQTYVVPARSRKLFPSQVADHGARRSFALTDPVVDEDGNVLKTGNDVVQRCMTEDADEVSPVGREGPILIEESRDRAENAVELGGGLLNPVKPTRGRGRPAKPENISIPE